METVELTCRWSRLDWIPMWYVNVTIQTHILVACVLVCTVSEACVQIEVKWWVYIHSSLNWALDFYEIKILQEN